jgi:hypothetical protein
MSIKQVFVNFIVVPFAAHVTPTLNENESDRQIVVSVETLSTYVFGINLSVIVSEVNLVKNTNEWWVDARAPLVIYVQTRKCFLQIYGIWRISFHGKLLDF